MTSTRNTKRIHLEIQTHRKNPVGLFRTTYYREGKILHDNLGSLNGLDIATLKLIQAALQGETVMKSDFHVLNSREYGASRVFLELAKDTGLDRLIYSRTSEQWVRDSIAMIAGRVVYAGSKLSLTRVNSLSTLWEQAGVSDDNIDVNEHCYAAMDKLLKRQDAIQKALAKKHLSDGVLILYDMTSTYFEGEYANSDLVEFGYNRDKKRGKEQVNIGLLCSKDGCPVAVSIFKGCTQDAETVNDKIMQIKKDFGINDVVFVGDRGMITKARLSDMAPGKEHHVRKISALTHAGIKSLVCDNDCVQLDMFDERQPIEIILPDTPDVRYALCLNPHRAAKETKTRRDLIEKLKDNLETVSKPKRKTSDVNLGIRVGKVLAKSKVGKFFEYSISGGKLEYCVNETKVAEEELYDGHYVIFTDVTQEQMNIREIVDGYRSLIHVEQAFRNLKSPTLEIRPVYHKTDDRIRCHVFLCMLSYYLLWHFKRRLKPIFDNDGEGENRRYTVDFLIKLLASIQMLSVEFSNVESTFISDVSDEQQMILDLLNVNVI